MAKKSRKPAHSQRSESAAAAQTRREALRQEQAAAETAARKKRIIIALAIVVAVALIITVVAILVTRNRASNRNANTSGDPTAQIVPQAASDDGLGILVYAGAADRDAPKVDVAFDFQCSHCATYENTYGHLLNSMAEQGKIELRYRILTFMDVNMGNDSSTRAAIAATCASETDHFAEYLENVFKNYAGSAGYTDDQLTNSFPAAAGMTGSDLEALQSCYAAKQTSDFVSDMAQGNLDDGITGTPTYLVNGNNFSIGEVDATEDALLSAIQAAA